MRDVAFDAPSRWFEEEIRAHLVEDQDERWVPNHWTGGMALALLVMASAGAILVGGMAIDPTRPYGALATPAGMPQPWMLMVGAVAAFGLAGVAAWFMLRQDDDLGVLIIAAIPPFRLMPMLGALWFATFFGLHAPLPALGVALVLLGTVVVALLRVGNLSRTACWLLLPALGAAAAGVALSAGIFALNADAPILQLRF